MADESREERVDLPVVPAARPPGAERRPSGGAGARALDPDGSGHRLPMNRRQALKVMAIAAAAPSLTSCAPGDPGGEGGADGGPDVSTPNPTTNPRAAGTAWDPDLIAPTVPWDRTLTDDQLQSLAALCDVIIPADERSPSASQVGAHDFIDEWVSAPYERHRDDGVLLRGGLVWLDREAEKRFGDGRRFRDLTAEQQHAICDDICWSVRAAPEFAGAARFFDRVRDLTSSAFWTTAEGMEDLRYVGNVPLTRWDPPPPEVLRHIGVEG